MNDKKFKFNILFNMMYQVLVVIMPLITTPYISRILGADKIGEYSFAQSIVSYFIIFATLGSSYYGQRCIAYCKDDILQRSKSFFEILLMRCITTVTMLVLFYTFIVLQVSNNVLYMIASIEIILVMFDISWLYQGVEDFKLLTICNGICKIIGTILIFCFVTDRNHLNRYVLLLLGSALIGHILTWGYLKGKIIIPRSPKMNIFQHLYPSMKLFVSQVAIQVYTVVDKTMIGVILHSNFENGYYEQSQKIIKALLAIVTSIGTVVSSRIAMLWKSGKKEESYSMIYSSFQLVFAFAFPMAVGINIIAHRIVPIYFGDGYEPVIPLLQIFSLLLPAIGASNILGIQFLIPTQREKWLTLSVVFGAILNFILNFFTISWYGAKGAAISSVIAEISIAIVQAILLRKELDLKRIFTLGIKYAGLSAIMGIITIFLDSWLSNGIINLIIIVIVSVATYMIMLLLIKDSLLKIIIREK